MKINFSNGETYKQAFSDAWNNLSQEDKDKVTSLPGFNAKDFLEYYGVDVEKKKLTKQELEKLVGFEFDII